MWLYAYEKCKWCSRHLHIEKTYACALAQMLSREINFMNENIQCYLEIQYIFNMISPLGS